jgi:hypothetical protein
VEQKGEDEEDLGCVSDSYNGGAATDGDDDEEDGEGGSEGGSNGAGGKTTAAATAALLKHRYIKDMYGTLGVSARLKNIGKIQFCGLLLQDKGQGWKQRRMVVLTSTKLLTFKLNSSAKTVRFIVGVLVVVLGSLGSLGSCVDPFSLSLFFLSVLSLQVRLSKNIQLTNIATWKRKEWVEGQRNKSGRRVGEGLIIELTNGKKKSFDFEGKGCWALGDALNTTKEERNTNYKE